MSSYVVASKLQIMERVIRTNNLFCEYYTYVYPVGDNCDFVTFEVDQITNFQLIH